MRRTAGAVAWGLLLLALAGVGLYVGLQVATGVSPPVAPVEPGQHLVGWSPGDAALLHRARIDRIAVGDLVALRRHGVVQIGVVEQADTQGTTVDYVVGRLPNGAQVEVESPLIVGAPGRKVPLAGWLLLPLRYRMVQIAAALVGGLLVLGLLSARQATSAPLGAPVWANEALALPPGRDRSRAAGPVVEPSPEPFVAGPGGVAYGERPMSITPDDLRQVRFAQTKRGYDTEAVDRALDSVADSIEHLLRERQQLVERLQQLEAENERYKGMEASLTQTLAMAERTAEELKAEAQAEARRIVAAAQQHAATAAPTVPPDAMVQLLGETRAIRSLLQAVLQQGVPPMPAPPPGWQPPPPPAHPQQ